MTCQLAEGDCSDVTCATHHGGCNKELGPECWHESGAIEVVHAGTLAAGRSIIDRFWDGRSKRTVKAYRDDLIRLARWSGRDSIDAFAEWFLGLGPGGAFQACNAFKEWAARREKPWAPSYVNNHLAALRSLVKFARRCGLVTWALDADSLKVERSRDTRGPGLDAIGAMIDAAESQRDPWAAARDRAILFLFATTGLRLFEVVGLDMEHVDLRGGRVFALRKRKRERVWVTIPDETTVAVRSWIAVRGGAPGPLFTSRSRGKHRRDHRLAESSVWAIVSRLGRGVGLEASKARPHGLRHATITKVLDMTNGDVRSARAFSGHAKIDELVHYDDNRQDVAGKMAGLLAAAIEEVRANRSLIHVDIPCEIEEVLRHSFDFGDTRYQSSRRDIAFIRQAIASSAVMARRIDLPSVDPSWFELSEFSGGREHRGICASVAAWLSGEGHPWTANPANCHSAGGIADAATTDGSNIFAEAGNTTASKVIECLRAKQSVLLAPYGFDDPGVGLLLTVVGDVPEDAEMKARMRAAVSVIRRPGRKAT